MNKCVCVLAHICFGYPGKRVIMKDVVEREHGLETFLAYSSNYSNVSPPGPVIWSAVVTSLSLVCCAVLGT